MQVRSATEFACVKERLNTAAKLQAMKKENLCKHIKIISDSLRNCSFAFSIVVKITSLVYAFFPL